MKLLQVSHYFQGHGGGIERVAYELGKRLATNGASVRWVASQESVDVTAAQGALAIRPVPAWHGIERVLNLPYPVWGGAAVGSLKECVEWCDVVHVHDALYMGSQFAGFLARAAGKPLVVTQHVGLVPYRSLVLRGAMQAANALLGAPLLRRADSVVYCGLQTQEYFARSVSDGRTHFVPNGVDLTTFRPPTDSERSTVRKGLGADDDRPVFLFVGRYVEKKGLGVLEELTRMFPSVMWVFAGSGPLAPSSWHRKNVVDLGNQEHENLRPLYGAADLLVLPSVGEGFPLVVQEAMACGTPAILSTATVRSFPNLHSVALGCDPGAESFAKAISDFIATRRKWPEWRARALDFARREWDWDTTVASYLRLFRALIGPSPVSPA